MAAPARSAIRSARRVRASSSRCSARCANTIASAAWRRFALAAAKRRRSRSSAFDARMIPLESWLLFCLACAALAATPGPNMLYLVSRTLAQGRAAGFVSLAGTSTGFALHAVAAALGLTALLAAVPVAFEVVRVAGALYLAWLAIVTWRASGDADPRVTAPRVANA